LGEEGLKAFFGFGAGAGMVLLIVFALNAGAFRLGLNEKALPCGTFDGGELLWVKGFVGRPFFFVIDPIH
jgi:hypothetical protein